MTFLRKLIALVSLAAVLLAALTPTSSTLFWAIVVPLLLFAGMLVMAPAECWREESTTQNLLCFPDISSRAPPAAASLN